MNQKKSFDFPYTCPLIDKEIEYCKNTIENYLTDYIEKLCPLMPEEEIKKISKQWGKDLYDAISSCFEIIRETNEKIRNEAEKQIDILENEIEILKSEIESLQNELDVLS